MTRAAHSVLPLLALVGISLVGPATPEAQVGSFPIKAITLICPFPPGGTMDGIARAAAEAVRKHLPRPVAVVNRPGGAGTIGVAEALQARPDGYTISIGGTAILAVSPHLTDLPFKGPEDVTPIIGLTSVPQVLAVAGTSPYKSLKDLLDASNANPGKVRIATSALGTLPNITVQRLKAETKAGFIIAPYTGGGEPVAAVLGGHVDATLETPVTVHPQAQAGKLRVLAVFGPKRTASAPDAPTLKEQGIDLAADINYFLVGPKDIPEPVAATLHEAFRQGMQDEIFVKFLRSNHLEPAYLSGQDLLASLKADYQAYGKVLEQLGLKKK